VWHACLSSYTAPCEPSSWADIGELAAATFGVLAVIAGFWLGLWALLEWVDSLLP